MLACAFLTFPNFPSKPRLKREEDSCCLVPEKGTEVGAGWGGNERNVLGRGVKERNLL